MIQNFSKKKSKPLVTSLKKGDRYTTVNNNKTMKKTHPLKISKKEANFVCLNQICPLGIPTFPSLTSIKMTKILYSILQNARTVPYRNR